MSSLAKSSQKNSFWTSIFKGVLLSTSVSLIGIFLFAVVLNYLPTPESYIMPINQVIKVVSLFVGMNAVLSANPQKGLLKGLLLGSIYTVFAYIIFSALSHDFSFNMTTINDIVFGALIAGILGIILVNFKKNRL